MGRYKSVLMAEKDAREFPHHVSVPVPPCGMGGRMEVIAAWLRANVGEEWRSHGSWKGGEQSSRYMFRAFEAAERFRCALALENWTCPFQIVNAVALRRRCKAGKERATSRM
jgi:hypothetical protein